MTAHGLYLLVWGVKRDSWQVSSYNHLMPGSIWPSASRPCTLLQATLTLLRTTVAIYREYSIFLSAIMYHDYISCYIVCWLSLAFVLYVMCFSMLFNNTVSINLHENTSFSPIMSEISSWLAVPVPTQDLLQSYSCQCLPLFERVNCEITSTFIGIYSCTWPP